MEIYNSYIRVPSGGIYESEICFIQSFDDFDRNFLYRDEFWIQFKNEYQKLTGYYQMNIPLTNFFGKAKEDFLKKFENKISSVDCAHRYYTYIKVISDRNNPQLNGQTMLFKYGRRIYDKLNIDKNKTFGKTFLLKVKLTQGFPNYDNCTFSDNNYYIRDINLNIRNIPSLKRLDLIKDMERKIKLSKITKKIKDNEKICM
jgi:hypothetical protein